MKWPQILVVLLGVTAMAVAVWRRPAQVPAAPAAVPPVAVAAVGARTLAPSFDRPGVASRLVGLLRTYVAVPEEVRLEASVDTAGANVARLPILIVFENETYRPLTAANIGWVGKSLCTVRVARLPTGGGEVEVFESDVPLPNRADWLSAERRNITVEWPLREGDGPSPRGEYRVSVRLGLPGEPAVEIYTRLL